jgi:uncharacterized spore protein YtfJ
MNDVKKYESVKESIKDLMTEVEKHNNIKAIFGDPVHEKDTVIIPVGTVQMSGGGGGGQGEDGSAEGMPDKLTKGKGSGVGMGYSRKVRPIGYIEIKDGKTMYKPIVDIGKIMSVAIGASIISSAMIAISYLKKRKS